MLFFDLSPPAGWAFHFFLDKKTKQKNQGSQRNVSCIFSMLKFGWVIFAASGQSFPVSLKHRFDPDHISLEAGDTQQ